MNWKLQVVTKPQLGAEGNKVWGDGSVFAVGDCNFGCIGNMPFKEKGELPIIPKISYPGEEQAMHACKNVEILDAQRYGSHGCCAGAPRKELVDTWWPWGAGMFATSLGPHDACFVLAANSNPGSGYMVNWWIPAALQKEVIETTKVDECKNRWIGVLIWHFVHHTPIHMWGKAPTWRLS